MARPPQVSAFVVSCHDVAPRDHSHSHTKYRWGRITMPTLCWRCEDIARARAHTHITHPIAHANHSPCTSSEARISHHLTPSGLTSHRARHVPCASRQLESHKAFMPSAGQWLHLEHGPRGHGGLLDGLLVLGAQRTLRRLRTTAGGRRRGESRRMGHGNRGMALALVGACIRGILL